MGSGSRRPTSSSRQPMVRIPLVLFAALGACAPASRGPVTEIAFDARTALDEPVVAPLVGDRLPMIEVEIAGCGSARFVVDSGMELSMLDRAFARTCGLATRGYAFELSIHTPSGALERVHECARVERIDIGTAAAFDLDMPLVDVRAIQPDADGFLGQDVIGDWALLFHAAKRELVILPADDLLKRLNKFIPAGTPMESLPISGDRRILTVGLEVGGGAMHVPLDVDTGSTSTTVPEAALDLLGVTGGSIVESTTLSGKESRRARKISGFPLGNQRIELVIESSPIDRGLLGYDALSQRIFVLDGPGRRLLIEASAVAPSQPAAEPSAAPESR
ncbi:MAG: hypothetical protein EPO68_12870 [Planctomycetota bacterium]|nr:MAG: hypothetical protein EPO68_12870 [Planctomycetota bacterium]